MGDNELDQISIGDYVLASRWGDRGWNDPWAIGFVQSKLTLLAPQRQGPIS